MNTDLFKNFKHFEMDPNHPENLKIMYISKIKDFKKRIEAIKIENDPLDEGEIYREYAHHYDNNEDGFNEIQSMVELEIYEHEKDSFYFQKDMLLSYLTFAFHTFEKDLKKFLFYSIMFYQKDVLPITKIILKEFIFNSTTDQILKLLPKIYGGSFKSVKIDKIRKLVNIFKHGINENNTQILEKSFPNNLKNYKFLDEQVPNYIDFEELYATEDFLYITQEELMNFCDDIANFWERMPNKIDKFDEQIKTIQNKSQNKFSRENTTK